MYLFGDPLNKQTFRGSFIIKKNAEDIQSWKESNQTTENAFQHILFQIYQNSELQSCFVSADVLALDR